MTKTRLCIALYMAGASTAVQAGLFTPGDVDVSAYASATQMRAEAGKFPAELWKIPLAQRVIEHMTVVDDGFAIVVLKNYKNKLIKDQIQGLDLNAGKTLWSFTVDEAGTDARVAFASSAITLIASVAEGRSILVAVHSQTGRTIWKKQLTGSVRYRVQPYNRDKIILAVKNGGHVDYQMLEARSGQKVWKRTVAIAGEGIPAVIATKQGLIVAAKTLALLDANSGRVLWRMAQISYDVRNPPPVLDGRDLYLMDAGYMVYRINLIDAKIIWRYKSAARYRISSIDPGRSKVYLRGMSDAVSGLRPVMIAVDREHGRLRWQAYFNDTLPLVSNLLEYKKRIFAASPTTLYAVNLASGHIAYAKKVAKSQLAVYPVILRRMGENIVFIGEMSVGAYRASSGDYVYRKNMTGISPEADLSALEKSIHRLSRKISTKSQPLRTSNIIYQQSLVVQASANAHYRNYSEARHLGEFNKANSEFLAYRIDNAFAKIYTSMALYEAVQNFSAAMYKGILEAMDKDTLARHKLIRHSIESAYPAMMSENYVYRPTRSLDLIDPDAPQFLQITAINLTNGRKSRTSMSIPFKEYGLWIYVDEKKKIAYQQSIGLQYSGEKPPSSYLIAKPIKLP